MAAFAPPRTATAVAAVAVIASVLLATPVIAAAIITPLPPHPIGYRAGVTGRLGDLGPRMPGSAVRNHMNPCNQTTVEAVYDVCDGPYSFTRCRGQDPLLIVDCIPKPEYQCWIDPANGEGACGKPVADPCVAGSGSSGDEWDGDVHE
ncbi:hypothetical protein MN608_04864 [Microdochium nivale]|nr:hypothetical protein MN608_04864 [Microdochium nivale]